MITYSVLSQSIANDNNKTKEDIRELIDEILVDLKVHISSLENGIRTTRTARKKIPLKFFTAEIKDRADNLIESLQNTLDKTIEARNKLLELRSTINYSSEKEIKLKLTKVKELTSIVITKGGYLDVIKNRANEIKNKKFAEELKELKDKVEDARSDLKVIEKKLVDTIVSKITDTKEKDSETIITPTDSIDYNNVVVPDDFIGPIVCQLIIKSTTNKKTEDQKFYECRYKDKLLITIKEKDDNFNVIRENTEKGSNIFVFDITEEKIITLKKAQEEADKQMRKDLTELYSGANFYLPSIETIRLFIIAAQTQDSAGTRRLQAKEIFERTGRRLSKCYNKTTP